jgi:lycopene cyclase domain-containing protein
LGESGISGKPGSFVYRYGKKQLYLVWWLLGVFLQIIISLPFIIKRINWKALGLTSLVFIVIMYASESIACYWGWWVWNENQIWGPKVGLIPLEEFLLYLLVVPSLVAFQCVIQNTMDKLKKKE